jgi:hypothetical protein
VFEGEARGRTLAQLIPTAVNHDLLRGAVIASEAKQSRIRKHIGFLCRFVPRNDESIFGPAGITTLRTCHLPGTRASSAHDRFHVNSSAGCGIWSVLHGPQAMFGE